MQPLNLDTARDMPHKERTNSLNHKERRLVGAFQYLGTFLESSFKFDLKKNNNTGWVAKQSTKSPFDGDAESLQHIYAYSMSLLSFFNGKSCNIILYLMVLWVICGGQK